MSKFRKILLLLGFIVIPIVASLVTFLGLSAAGVIIDDTTPLVYTIESVSKAYDGTPLKANSATLTEGELKEGHQAQFSFNGELTEVGESTSDALVKIVDDNGVDVTGEYSIKVNKGTLTVTKQAVSIILDDCEMEYNGGELICDNYEIVSGYLAAGHVIVPTTDDATLVNVHDELPDASTFVPYIYDNSGHDQSHNYDITFSIGANVKINPRKLVVKPADLTFTYDGKGHTFDSYEILRGSLVDGHYIDAIYEDENGIIEEPYIDALEEMVIHFNSVRILTRENGIEVDVTENYDLTYSDTGSIVIDKAIIEVELNDVKSLYTGNAFGSEEGYNANELFSILEPTDKLILNNAGAKIVPDLEGLETVKEEGQHEFYLFSDKLAEDANYITLKVEDDNKEDITSNFEFVLLSGNPGTITITKLEIDVELPVYEKSFDNKEWTLEKDTKLDQQVTFPDGTVVEIDFDEESLSFYGLDDGKKPIYADEYKYSLKINSIKKCVYNEKTGKYEPSTDEKDIISEENIIINYKGGIVNIKPIELIIDLKDFEAIEYDGLEFYQSILLKSTETKEVEKWYDEILLKDSSVAMIKDLSELSSYQVQIENVAGQVIITTKSLNKDDILNSLFIVVPSYVENINAKDVGSYEYYLDGENKPYTISFDIKKIEKDKNNKFVLSEKSFNDSFTLTPKYDEPGTFKITKKDVYVTLNELSRLYNEKTFDEYMKDKYGEKDKNPYYYDSLVTSDYKFPFGTYLNVKAETLKDLTLAGNYEYYLADKSREYYIELNVVTVDKDISELKPEDLLLKQADLLKKYGEKDVTSNYNFILKEGQVTSFIEITKPEITVTFISDEKTFDGKTYSIRQDESYTVDGLPDIYEVRIKNWSLADKQIVDADEYINTAEVSIYNKETKKLIDNTNGNWYTLIVNNGTIMVNKADLVVELKDVSKLYDGNVFNYTVDTLLASKTELPRGMKYELDNINTIKNLIDAGTYEYYFDDASQKYYFTLKITSANGEDYTDNFNITASNETAVNIEIEKLYLEIDFADKEVYTYNAPNITTGNDDTKVTSYYSLVDSKLPSGATSTYKDNSFTLVGKTLSVAGEYEINAEFEVYLSRASTPVAANNIEIVINSGTLTVVRPEIVVNYDSFEKEFTGEYFNIGATYTSNIEDLNDSLLTLKSTNPSINKTTIYRSGEYEVSSTLALYYNNSLVNEDLYDLVINKGTLKVNKADFNIELKELADYTFNTKSLTKKYDKVSDWLTLDQPSGFEVSVSLDNLDELDAKTYTYTVNGDGEYDIKLTIEKNYIDYTDCFNLVFANDESEKDIEITKVELVVDLKDVTKTYNNKSVFEDLDYSKDKDSKIKMTDKLVDYDKELIPSGLTLTVLDPEDIKDIIDAGKYTYYLNNDNKQYDIKLQVLSDDTTDTKDYIDNFNIKVLYDEPGTITINKKDVYFNLNWESKLYNNKKFGEYMNEKYGDNGNNPYYYNSLVSSTTELPFASLLVVNAEKLEGLKEPGVYEYFYSDLSREYYIDLKVLTIDHEKFTTLELSKTFLELEKTYGSKDVTENYNFIMKNGQISSTIEIVKPEITVIFKSGEKTFDGNRYNINQNSAYDVEGLPEEYGIRFIDPTRWSLYDETAAVKAGTYENASREDNFEIYNISTNETIPNNRYSINVNAGEIVVNKADFNIELKELADYTFNSKSLIETYTQPSDWVSYTTPSGFDVSITLNNLNVSDAGTYNYTVNGEGANDIVLKIKKATYDYTDQFNIIVTNIEESITINKKEIVIDLKKIEVTYKADTYDENDITDYIVSCTDDLSTDKFTVIAEDMKNAGEYEYSVVFKDESMNENYELKIKNEDGFGLFVIDKAQITITGEVTDTYDAYAIDFNSGTYIIKDADGQTMKNYSVKIIDIDDVFYVEDDAYGRYEFAEIDGDDDANEPAITAEMTLTKGLENIKIFDSKGEDVTANYKLKTNSSDDTINPVIELTYNKFALVIQGERISIPYNPETYDGMDDIIDAIKDPDGDKNIFYNPYKIVYKDIWNPDDYINYDNIRENISIEDDQEDEEFGKITDYKEGLQIFSLTKFDDGDPLDVTMYYYVTETAGYVDVIPYSINIVLKTFEYTYDGLTDFATEIEDLKEDEVIFDYSNLSDTLFNGSAFKQLEFAVSASEDMTNAGTYSYTLTYKTDYLRLYEINIVPGTVIVKKEDVKVTLNNIEKVYDENGYELSSLYDTFIRSVEANTLTENDFEVVDQTLTEVGTYSYTVKPSDLSDDELNNYNITISSATFTIKKKDVYVTLKSFIETYKDEGYSSDDIDYFVVHCSESFSDDDFTVRAGTMINAGTYTYTVEFANSDNNDTYNLIVSSGTFTINKQDVYISLRHYTGESVDVVNIDDLKPEIDDLTVDLILPTVTEPGTYYYSISVSGDALRNYNVYVIGTGAVTIVSSMG